MSDNFTPLTINPEVGAPPGNTNAMKYKTPEERQALCDKYCAYVKQGYSKIYFPECDYDTFVRYCRDFPIDFPADVIRSAETEGMLKIEQIGMAGMLGKVEGFREKTWIFIAKNKLGWRERTDITTADEKIEGPSVYIPIEKDE